MITCHMNTKTGGQKCGAEATTIRTFVQTGKQIGVCAAHRMNHHTEAEGWTTVAPKAVEIDAADVLDAEAAAGVTYEAMSSHTHKYESIDTKWLAKLVRYNVSKGMAARISTNTEGRQMVELRSKDGGSCYGRYVRV